MDIRSIIAPTVSDREALEEFVESLSDHAPNIERDIARLKKTPEDREVISSLFRSIHNIKGDAALCKIDLAVAIVHPIETVLARFRNDEIIFSDIVAEAILLAFDRLELASEGLLSRKSLDGLRLLALVQGLETLALAGAAELDDCAGDLIASGTPAGVGMGRGVFLKDGDVMTAWVDGVGELANPVSAPHLPRGA